MNLGHLLGQFRWNILGFNPIAFLYMFSVYQCISTCISVFFMYILLPNTCVSPLPCILTFFTRISVYNAVTARIQPLFRFPGPVIPVSSLICCLRPIRLLHYLAMRLTRKSNKWMRAFMAHPKYGEDDRSPRGPG